MMNAKILLFSILCIGLVSPFSATAQTTDNLLGDWNAEAPDAPREFMNSLMEITRDSVFTTFSGETYTYGSTSVNFKNDTLTFVIIGLDVFCTLRPEDKTRLTGKAVWEGGESPLILTRKEELKPDDASQE
jgi:hypothetical protein